MEEQAALGTSGSKIWVKSIAHIKVGKDAAQMVDDVRVFATSGRKRHTTWEMGGGKAEQQFCAHTMGYKAPQRSESAEIQAKIEDDLLDVEIIG